MDAVPELNTNGALTELWDQFEGGMNYQVHPDWFQDWSEKEAVARRLRWYQPSLVPGLLQTEEYARAVFRSRFGMTDEEVEERVKARLKRHEILKRNSPPALWVIIEEWVLRRPVGGPQAMLEQVNRLIEAAKQPNIVIEVIRSTVGAHPGLDGGGFAIADFEDEPSLGYQEGTVRGHPIRDRKDVEALELAWDTVRHEAEISGRLAGATGRSGEVMDLSHVSWREAGSRGNNGGNCVEVGIVWRKATSSGSNGGDCVEVGTAWRKATYSGSSSGCVEVASTPAAVVAVRDSKDPDGPALALTPRDWRAFTDRVKTGELDLS